jgi:hypothetical protein
MAKRITAIKAYAPRLKLNRTLQTATLSELIQRRTAFNRGEILGLLSELNELIIDHLLRGTPVKIDGLGTFSPAIHLDGSLHVNVRIDRSLIWALNGPEAFKGKVINRRNIGLSAGDLIAQWNRHRSEDPVG